MSLKLEFDVAKIAAQFKEIALEVEQDLNRSVASLAAMTHAKVSELASEELHSSLKNLQDSLGFEEISTGIWVVSIDEKGLFIEEGIESSKDMKEDLLRNNARISASGHRYKVIPFDHGKAPTQLTPKAQELVGLIRQKLKKEKVPFKKIEKNADGSPRLGKLHSFDIESERPTPRSSHPALKGVTIYQSKGANGSVRRDIFTFRTVTDSGASDGKWIHPGLKAKHFLDRAAEWAMDEWEKNILPEVLSKYKD